MVAELGKLQMIDKGFIERIIDREKKQSTIFGGGIAFPIQLTRVMQRLF